jgi:Cu/Zn superoxide dismutase
MKGWLDHTNVALSRTRTQEGGACYHPAEHFQRRRSSMSRFLILPVLLALLAVGVALPGSVAAGGGQWEMVPLNDTGVTGSGTWEPMGTPTAPVDEVTFNLELEGLEPNSEHVAHVHRGSSCDDIGEIRFELGTITADADGDASMSTVVATSPEIFYRIGEGHVLIVHAGATLEEDPTPISCGALPHVEEATGRGEGDVVIAPPATGSGGLLDDEAGGLPTLPFILAGLAVASLAAGAIGRRLSRPRR